jgi:DivIVA domain-containing protein
MQWVLWMIAVAVLGLAAVAAAGRLGSMPDTVSDTPRPHVPTGELTGDDLRGLRFAVVPRGYSMDQVDELLDRLARQLDGPEVPPQPLPVSDLPAPDRRVE